MIIRMKKTIVGVALIYLYGGLANATENYDLQSIQSRCEAPQMLRIMNMCSPKIQLKPNQKKRDAITLYEAQKLQKLNKDIHKAIHLSDDELASEAFTTLYGYYLQTSRALESEYVQKLLSQKQEAEEINTTTPTIFSRFFREQEPSKQTPFITLQIKVNQALSTNDLTKESLEELLIQLDNAKRPKQKSRLLHLKRRVQSKLKELVPKETTQEITTENQIYENITTLIPTNRATIIVSEKLDQGAQPPHVTILPSSTASEQTTETSEDPVLIMEDEDSNTPLTTPIKVQSAHTPSTPIIDDNKSNPVPSTGGRTPTNSPSWFSLRSLLPKLTNG